METCVHSCEPIRFRSAYAQETTKPCQPTGFRVSSALAMSDPMSHARSMFRPLLAGLLVTLAQLFVAVVLIAPEGPLAWRYSTLVQHDSYWFANIVDRGYATTVPPISHKMMEVSNVAFFPAYPAMAGALKSVLHLSTYTALLVTAQGAAFGFWSYFFLFCERWGLSPLLQFFGVTAVLSHPAAFFLVAAYSESIFLFGVLGFIYWSTSTGKLSGWLAVLHGIVMSAARIVGMPCAAVPVVAALVRNGWSGLTNVRSWLANYRRAVAVTAGATVGAFGFLFYCAFNWGRWDMYMLTQEAGWAIDPDYLAVFKPSSYYWHIPHLNDPVTMSQMAMTFGAIMLALIVACELLPMIRRAASLSTRIAFYFAGAVIYYISVSGVACVAMESMLRYEFCTHVLIVLAFLHFLHQLPVPRPWIRATAMGLAALACAAGLSLQGWYVWNFTRGGWVA